MPLCNQIRQLCWPAPNKHREELRHSRATSVLYTIPHNAVPLEWPTRRVSLSGVHSYGRNILKLLHLVGLYHVRREQSPYSRCAG